MAGHASPPRPLPWLDLRWHVRYAIPRDLPPPPSNAQYRKAAKAEQAVLATRQHDLAVRPAVEESSGMAAVEASAEKQMQKKKRRQKGEGLAHQSLEDDEDFMAL